MTEYLKKHQEEVIDMFGFEWNEQEAREALLKAGEAAMKALGIAPSDYQKYLMML